MLSNGGDEVRSRRTGANQPDSPRAAGEAGTSPDQLPHQEKGQEARSGRAAEGSPRGWLTPRADLSTPPGPQPFPIPHQGQDWTIETARHSCENSCPSGRDKGMQSINQKEIFMQIN